MKQRKLTDKAYNRILMWLPRRGRFYKGKIPYN